LLQLRFFDRPLRTVQEYNEKAQYIHLNPVRAGLARRPEAVARTAASVVRGFFKRRTADRKNGGPRYLLFRRRDGGARSAEVGALSPPLRLLLSALA
jgi:hypothetical protein